MECPGFSLNRTLKGEVLNQKASANYETKRCSSFFFTSLKFFNFPNLYCCEYCKSKKISQIKVSVRYQSNVPCLLKVRSSLFLKEYLQSVPFSKRKEYPQQQTLPSPAAYLFILQILTEYPQSAGLLCEWWFKRRRAEYIAQIIQR